MIEVKDLTKTFGAREREIRALDEVSFTTAKEGATALLGPNAAGKTTLLRILSTVLIPTSGQAFVNGHSVVEAAEEVRKSIGLVTSSERTFYFRLSGMENLLAFGILYDFKVAEARGRALELLDQVGLSDWADVLYMRYSLGMQRRLALARALFHDPPVLLMDEPTLGIDVESAKNVIELSRVLSGTKTILFTSHNMSEVQELASKVCLLNAGRLIAAGTPSELKAANGLPESSTMEDVYLRIVGETSTQHGLPGLRRKSIRHE